MDTITRTHIIKKKEPTSTLLGSMEDAKMDLLKKSAGVELVQKMVPGQKYAVSLYETRDTPDYDDKSDVAITLKVFISIKQIGEKT